jgi:hypothetical protein
VIEGLEGHPRRHRSIANHRHDPSVVTEPFGTDGHSQGGAYRGAGVSDPECVVLTFRARRKWRKSTRLLDGV